MGMFGDMRRAKKVWKAFHNEHKKHFVLADGVTNKVYVTDTEVIQSHMVGGVQRRPLTGATVRVDRAGDVRSHGTLTRSVVSSGWQKEIDGRTATLVITGPDFEWSFTLPSYHVTLKNGEMLDQQLIFVIQEKISKAAA